jgi:Ca2+-transporting ATPase
MSFIVAVHVPIAGLALFPLLLGMPVFLALAHIALLEMIIDPTCSVVFEAEAAEADVMRRSPRGVGQMIFAGRRLRTSLLQGFTVLLVVGAVLLWGRAAGLRLEAVRTVAFLALVLGVLALVQVNRRFADARKLHGRLNWPLLWVIGLVAAIMAGVLAWPALRRLLEFEAMTALEAAVALGAGLLSLVALSLVKALSPRPGGT